MSRGGPRRRRAATFHSMTDARPARLPVRWAGRRARGTATPPPPQTGRPPYLQYTGGLSKAV